jgi:hypothetical protein
MLIRAAAATRIADENEIFLVVYSEHRSGRGQRTPLLDLKHAHAAMTK